jgi:hypothetical protein
MAPGINGEGKWKVVSLLLDNGMQMKEGDTVVILTDVTKNTAIEQNPRWAEDEEVKDILTKWELPDDWSRRCLQQSRVESGVMGHRNR